jgi:mono/diheme cytochrome c family protein
MVRGEKSVLKRVMALVATFAVAGMLAAGCSKSSDDQNAKATATGPITDAGDTGMKPVAGATPSMGDAKHGEAIFGQNCSSCHGAAGAGGGIGPVLKGEKSRKNYEAAIAWIKNPRQPMPKLYPSTLSESDVADVAAYVETL